jgi:hypothetical protein
LTTIAHDPTRRTGPTNERVELGRYTISAGERILYRQRVLGVVWLTDVPAHGHGRRYIMDRGLDDRTRAKASIDTLHARNAPPAQACSSSPCGPSV